MKQVKGVDSHLFVGHSLDRRFAFNETDLLIDTQNVIQERPRRHLHEIFRFDKRSNEGVKFDKKRHSHQFMSMDEEVESGVATAIPTASTAVLKQTKRNANASEIEERPRRHLHEIFRFNKRSNEGVKIAKKRHSHQFVSMDEEEEPKKH